MNTQSRFESNTTNAARPPRAAARPGRNNNNKRVRKPSECVCDNLVQAVSDLANGVIGRGKFEHAMREFFYMEDGVEGWLLERIASESHETSISGGCRDLQGIHDRMVAYFPVSNLLLAETLARCKSEDTGNYANALGLFKELANRIFADICASLHFRQPHQVPEAVYGCFRGVPTPLKALGDLVRQPGNEQFREIFCSTLRGQWKGYSVYNLLPADLQNDVRAFCVEWNMTLEDYLGTEDADPHPSVDPVIRATNGVRDLELKGDDSSST